MSDQPISRTEPIVPERDEQMPRPDRSARGGHKKTRGSDGGSGSGWFWKFLILLLMLAVGGMAYLGFEQQQRLTQKLNQLQADFDAVKGRLESTDESVNQSGAVLGLKLKEQAETLDKHWSEIKKLWGVSNDRNKNAIAANEETIKGFAEQIKGVKNSTIARKKEVAALQQKMDKNLAELNRAIESATSAALATKLEMEEALGGNQSIVDRLNRIENTQKRWQQGVNARVAANEEAVKSIDAYRRSTNQQLLQIKQQLAGQ